MTDLLKAEAMPIVKDGFFDEAKLRKIVGCGGVGGAGDSFVELMVMSEVCPCVS